MRARAGADGDGKKAKRVTRHGASGQTILVVLTVVTLLAALPVAVWLDSAISPIQLPTQALRSRHHHHRHPRLLRQERRRARSSPRPDDKRRRSSTTIPTFPAPSRSRRRMSLELGDLIARPREPSATASSPTWPFASRAPHNLDAFETTRSKPFAREPAGPALVITEVGGSSSTGASAWPRPSVMAEACVACHNTHPESPKRDWKVGDVRGIQEVTLTQPIAANIFSFKYLLRLFRRRRPRRHRLRRAAVAPGARFRRHEQRARGGQLLPRHRLDEDLEISLAAGLQDRSFPASATS